MKNLSFCKLNLKNKNALTINENFMIVKSQKTIDLYFRLGFFHKTPIFFLVFLQLIGQPYKIFKTS